MSALGRVVRAGVGRRRAQTVVMTLTTMLAVVAAILGTGLIVASRAPFDHAFAAHRGAHLTARFDGTRATRAQVAATAQVPDLTAAAGPYPVLTTHVRWSDDVVSPPLTVMGRSRPGGPVGVVDLVQGRWAAGPGEAVVNASGVPFQIGDRLTFTDAPGRPSLRIVGLTRATDVNLLVTPDQLAALTPAGTAPDLQMLYRFAHAGTDAAMARNRAAIAAAVPRGAMTEADSYLTLKKEADRTAATFVPFIVAFALLGLCMSVLTIAVIVSGSVGAATRRIGVLKAVGFTPAQVVRAYLAQALIPATVGTVLGTLLGNALAAPVLRDQGTVYGTGSTTLAGWVDVAVPAAALVIVAVTALVPALRAGRLRAVEALAVGRTPRAGRGRKAQWLVARLPIPRAVSLGMAATAARPARSATMLAAVVLGAVGVTFGAGLAMSLDRIQHGLNRDAPGDVAVHNTVPPSGTSGPPAGPPKAAPPDDIAAAIRAQPGTRRFFSTYETTVSLAGLAGQTTVIAYTGDSSWGSYQLVAGRWFHGAGEAVVPSGFLSTTGMRLGDTVTLVSDGRRATVRLVGEVLSLREMGMLVLTDASSVARPSDAFVSFAVQLKPGTDRAAYAGRLNAALAPIGGSAMPQSGAVSATVIAMDTLTGTFTLLLVVVAGLGVFNTVVLDTRDRVHDLGVLKAVGMSPRQTITMVLTSVGGIGLCAGVIGVPAGVALHAWVLPVMGRAAGTRIPSADLAVYDLRLVLPLLFGGLVIALAGALIPAGWAARARTATALRAE